MSHTPEINLQAFERMVFEESMRRAMDRGALLLHRQLQGDVRTGRFVGAEAPQRWRCPEPGIVMPVRLIPMLEENGRIMRLGEWSCSPPALTPRYDRTPGSPLGVAVNLSALRFNQNTFTEKVDRVLEETGLDSLDLKLEFTESLIMVDTCKSVARLDEFRKLGIKPV